MDITIPSLEPFVKGRLTRDEQSFPGIVQLLTKMKVDAPEFLGDTDVLGLKENEQVFRAIIKEYFLK